MKIRISQYSFEVGQPFAEGHALTTNEAEALNRLRAENIRNNCKKWIDQAEAASGGLLSPLTVEELAERIGLYAQGYEFGGPLAPKGGIRKTQLEIEIESLARERVESKLRGLQIELSQEALEVEISREARLEEVQIEARRRIANRAQVAQEALEGLIS